MNPIESARSRLSPEWQPLSAIKLHPNAGDWGFRDLRDAREAAEDVVLQPYTPKHAGARQAVILTAMRRAIREAVVASGAVEAMNGLEACYNWPGSGNFGPEQPLWDNHAIALAKLRALTQP